LLGIPEQGTKVPSPGLLLYTASMPAMVLTNISTPVNMTYLSNPHAAEFHELDDLQILCTKPPACLLFKPNQPKAIQFYSLSWDILPIFPLKTSVTIKGYSVR
jgi:hypothetical protein